MTKKTTGPGRHRPGARTIAVCEALELAPTDIYGIKARTGLILNAVHKVCTRGALMGLFTRDKSYTPQQWSVRPDWREAIEKGLLNKVPDRISRNSTPSAKYEGIKSRRPDRKGPLVLQSVWGAVVGQSLSQ